MTPPPLSVTGTATVDTWKRTDECKCTYMHARECVSLLTCVRASVLALAYVCACACLIVYTSLSRLVCQRQYKAIIVSMLYSVPSPAIQDNRSSRTITIGPSSGRYNII